MKVREKLRTEQMLPDVRWRVLREQRRREEAAARVAQRRLAKKEPTAVVLSLLERLRSKLDRIVKMRGGTEYSVLKSCLLQWGSKATGRLSSEELLQALTSLGLRTTVGECEETIACYGNEYNALCSAVACRHFLQHPSQQQPTQIPSSRADLSPLVRRFLKKLRRKLAVLVERHGEYERIILHRALVDWGTSRGDDGDGKLGARQLLGAMSQVGMKLSIDEATEILQAFSFSPHSLTDAVCEDVPHFFDSRKKISKRAAPEEDAEDERALWKMFTARPVDGPVPKKNAVVEMFKINLRKALDKRSKSGGGPAPSILREACLFWDADASGELNAREFRGAMARVGLLLSKDDALQVVRFYDRNGKVGKYDDGEIHYKDLVDDVLRHVPHFTTCPQTPSARKTNVVVTPSESVAAVLEKIRTGAVSAAKGRKKMNPRDLLLGTCVRVDRENRGKLTKSAFVKVLRELRIRDDVGGLDDLVAWYNNDGTRITIPYGNVVDDAFCASRRASSLPDLRAK